jgi:hypothetical protein
MMKKSRYFVYLLTAIFLARLVAGCKPRADMMSTAECLFIKMVDKTARKLDLNEEQKVKLNELKVEIRKNFQDGREEKKEVFLKIKEEAMKENPEIGKMTALFQDSTRAEAQRINRAFDLLLGFQSNLNDVQKKKLTQMISDWVKKWD